MSYNIQGDDYERNVIAGNSDPDAIAELHQEIETLVNKLPQKYAVNISNVPITRTWGNWYISEQKEITCPFDLSQATNVQFTYNAQNGGSCLASIESIQGNKIYYILIRATSSTVSGRAYITAYYD